MNIDTVTSTYGAAFWQNSGSGSAGSAAATGALASAADAYSSAAGSDLIDSLAAAVRAALDGIGLDDADRITFADLLKARQSMEDAFTADVRRDLENLGLDPSAEFRLVTSEDGIAVLSSHPDAAAIERYFADTPERETQFRRIQALSNVETARKSGGYDARATRSRIQIESMAAWFAQSGQTVQQFMEYQDGEALYSIAGLSVTA
jgi:hypothetical protein